VPETRIDTEVRFQSAFAQSAIAASITSPDGRWLFVNRSLADLLGYSEEELKGRAFQTLTHPDDVPQNLVLLQRALSGEIDRYTMEKRLLHASGETVWVLLTVALVRGDDRAPLYLVTQYQDLTARKRAEVQLRESEERYRQVVETAHEGICIVDPNGRIAYANTRLGTLLMARPEDLIGHPIFEFMAPDHAFYARSRFARRQRGISEVEDLVLRRADGGALHVRTSASSLIAGNGVFSGAVYMLTDVTERYAAEQRVAASERYFRALTEQSSEVVCVVDEHAVFQYANLAWGPLLGYQPQEVVGRLAFDFIAPEDLERVKTLFAEIVRAPDTVISAEFALIHRDGTRRVLSGIGRNMLNDPAVRGIVVNSYDITDRRRAEQALHASEARFSHIAANVPGMVYQWVYPPVGPGGYTFVSEGARRMFGIAPEAALQNPAMLSDRAVTATPFRWEGRIVIPSGEERFVQISAHNERASDGSVFSDGLITDVTELRNASRRLDESEQRYRSLFAHNPDAVFSLDVSGQFLSANPACYTLFGYAEGELLGAAFEPLLYPEDLGTARESFGAAVAGKATQYEVAIRHRSGKRVQLGVTNVPMIVGGRVIGVFGIAKDLTVQRELEQQLRQSQKMEAVGRLAGGVAHDFNNLLTVIISYTQMALGTLAPDASASADLREVESSAGRAAELTRQLLAFSRQQVLRPTRIDVNQVVTESVGMLRRLIGEDVALQTALAPGLWPVHSDPGQLSQVLMNLAVNARDAMIGGGTLSLRTQNVIVDAADDREHPELAAGAYAAIVVEDTGTGIDPSVLPNIFEPFYTTKGAGHGTGLGLATVYGIVKQSDGFVYAESVPGKGSRFTVLLPRTDRDGHDDAQSPGDAPPRGHETVLLVEDADAVRSAVRRMLESLGYTVLEAASAPEALYIATKARTQRAPIHLVLTDVVMPEISGRALREQLATLWPELKVLYMSGYTNDEILRRGLGESGEMLLEKPFTLDRLAAAVRRSIDATNGHPRSQNS
jgi:PAS domain S-box-containing protein